MGLRRDTCVVAGLILGMSPCQPRQFLEKERKVKFDILNRYTGEVEFTAEIECSEGTNKAYKTGLAVSWAIKNKVSLSGANLSGADLSGADLSRADLSRADLSGADLIGANLRGSSLRGTNLRGFKHDIWAVLQYAPHEVPNLIKAIKEGEIDGSCYEGECCCLCGTLEKGLDENIEVRDANSPAEQWFSMIKEGDTPENNKASKMALEWIEEWQILQARTAA